MDQNKQLIPELRFPGYEDEWVKKKLGDITTWSSGGTPFKDKSEYWSGSIPWISASSMRGNQFLDADLYITEEGLKNGSRLAKKGSLLILVRGSMLFNRIPIGIAMRDVAFNQDVKAIEDSDAISNYFLLHWFAAHEAHWLNLVTGTGIGAGKIDLADLKAFEIVLPSVPEQQKIAAFISAVDTKLQVLREDKELLEAYKKGVMQRLFSGELRFKDEEGQDYLEWEEKMGDEVFESISNRDHSSDLPILAITQDLGAVPRDMIDYNISVTDKSIATYKVVEVGDFIISLRSFQGGIEYSDYRGICSPAYVILRPKLNLSRQFFKYYLKTDEYIKKLNRNIEGIRDGKMISYKYFSEIELPFPSIEEQVKIANFLSVLDQKIRLCNMEIEKIARWKKGLLQKMFC